MRTAGWAQRSLWREGAPVAHAASLWVGMSHRVLVRMLLVWGGSPTHPSWPNPPHWWPWPLFPAAFWPLCLNDHGGMHITSMSDVQIFYGSWMVDLPTWKNQKLALLLLALLFWNECQFLLSCWLPWFRTSCLNATDLSHFFLGFTWTRQQCLWLSELDERSVIISNIKYSWLWEN